MEGVTYGLADQLEAVEPANYGQDASGVGALFASGADEPHASEPLEHVI